MIVTTRRKYIRKIIKDYINNAKRFSSYYYSKEKSEAMQLLDPTTATTNDFDNITGSHNEKHLRCGECGKEVDAIVQLGEEPDYESCTAYICLNCLKGAVVEIECS